MIPDTAPFDVSGRPATTVPAGLAEGLPAGMTITGRRFDDATCAWRTPSRHCAAFPAPPA